jgi:hypothetical protein
MHPSLSAMAHKQVLFRSAAREKILRGATQLADAVRVTLGSRHAPWYILIDTPRNAECPIDVRFTPESRHPLPKSECLLWANSRQQVQQKSVIEGPAYSITSSAVARSVGGIFTPSDLAVVEFTISSKRVGRSAGKSPGLVPLRILATIMPTSRYCSSILGP